MGFNVRTRLSVRELLNDVVFLGERTPKIEVESNRGYKKWKLFLLRSVFKVCTLFSNIGIIC